MGRSKGQTDQVPNLERAGVNTQTRPGAEGELGEGAQLGSLMTDVSLGLRHS